MSRGAAAITGNAIVWGVMLITVSLVLKGTEQAEQVRLIISGGAGGSLLIIAGALRRK